VLLTISQKCFFGSSDEQLALFVERDIK